MRQLVVSEFITLDGIFEDPGGADNTPHGGWSRQFSGPDYQKYKYDELMAADALLLGRITYEGFAAAWPSMEGAGVFGEKMNSINKYVVSTTLDHLEWNNSHPIKDGIAAEVKELKEQDGKNILVAGSGQLARYLLDNGLVDKLCLMVHPVIIGSGKRFFDGASYRPLKLEKEQALDSGTVILEYAF